MQQNMIIGTSTMGSPHRHDFCFRAKDIDTLQEMECNACGQSKLVCVFAVNPPPARHGRIVPASI